MSGVDRIGLVSGDYASSSEEEEAKKDDAADFVKAAPASKEDFTDKEEKPKSSLFGLTGDGDDEDDSSTSATSQSSNSESDTATDESPSKKVLPNFLKQPESSLETSVFSNSYRERELANTALLEQHVKMTDSTRPSRGNSSETAKHKHRKGRGKRPFCTAKESEQSDDDNQTSRKRKVRVGITNSLVPPKRALQQLDRIRANEKHRMKEIGKH